jgi:hypothetical protein
MAYRALGIDPSLFFTDIDGRPRRFVDHDEPILDFFR